MSLKVDTGMAAAGGVGLLAWYLYGKRAAIANALNPASGKNLAYTGVNSVLQKLTGNPYTTAGSLLFDVLNPNAGKSATTSTPLAVGSPGWYKSYGASVPPGVTSDPTTWTNPFNTNLITGTVL